MVRLIEVVLSRKQEAEVQRQIEQAKKDAGITLSFEDVVQRHVNESLGVVED